MTCFAYDALHRVTSVTYPSGSCTPSYDANGNSLNDCYNSYSWSADGKALTIANGGSSVGAAYDAMGDMVEQTRGSAYTQVVYAPDGTKLALMNGTSTIVKAFVPLTGGATAIYNSSGLAYYRHADWLGSSRLTSTASRTVYADAAYAPFGETYAAMGTPDASFTGMNQDTVPTVDDFPAREYGSLSGRWASPDPLGVGAVDPTDPQSWNRYAYVRNSPLTLTDPDGLDYAVCIGNSYGNMGTPVTCQDYGGDTVADLDLALPIGFYAIGDDESGAINSVNSQAMVGMYFYFQGCSGVCVVSIDCVAACNLPPPPPGPPSPGQPIDPGNTDGGGGGGGAGTVPLDYLQKGVNYLKTFSTKSPDCLKDLAAVGLNQAKIRSDAATIKMVNALASGYQYHWPSGADFYADTKAPTPTIAYNSLYYWQTSYGQILGTLVHEYAHFAQPTVGDAGLQHELGIAFQPNDTNNISQKFADDCFPGMVTP